MKGPLLPQPERLIESRNNGLAKRIRALHQRAERDHTGLYYVEGVRFVARAVQCHAWIETLVVCPPLLIHPFAQKLVRRLQRAGTPMLLVSPEVLYSLALVDDPQGIGAVVRQKWERLERVIPGEELCWLVHDVVHAPGNLGTILRTSEAVGGAGVILLEGTTDPYDPATVRSTMGALFSQRFVRTTLPTLRRWKDAGAWYLVGTSPSATADYHTATYDQPTLLLMGGERRGLSDDLRALCDVVVRIPMVGRSDSLNLAVATGLMLYELFNQRRTTAATGAAGTRSPR
jgi:TrmH family RNA methyltransferase